MNLSLFKASVILLVVVLLLGGGFYFWNIFSSGGINIEVNAEEDRVIGEPFDLKVSFSNSSNSVLNELKVILEVSDGTILVNGVDKKIMEREVGNIDIGAVHQETFKVMATPLPDAVRNFNVTLSYIPGTIAARFEKNKSFSIDVKPLETELNLMVPEKVFSGEEFEIKGDYKAKEPDKSPDITLKITYPEGFQKASEDVGVETPTSGKSSIKGKVNFPDDASFDVKAEIVTSLLGKEYIVTEKISQILVSPSPLFLRTTLNGGTDFVAHLSDTLNYTLTYKNNTNVALQDIVLRAKLTGDMFDLSSLDAGGAKFNPFQRVVTWDSVDFKELATLSPGEERSINFSLKLRSFYPIKKLNDKNFSIKVESSIESPTVPFLVSADKTTNFSLLETKVSGKIEVDTRGFFRDATSGILNKGLWPPKVGSTTQFTVHWLLTNYSSDVRNIEVRAALEDSVTFTGVVKSNTTPPPEINQETGEIVWRIDRLVATTGITGEKPEAIFQIEAMPTPNKRGNYMPLISITQVKAFDEFTDVEISGLDMGLTTRLADDLTVYEGQGIIVE
jgi:hypothetical protein